jgi:hypothetical protein
MRTWLLLAAIAVSGAALSWSCSGMRSGGAAKGSGSAPEPQVAYTFLGITSDTRGEMFPCG